MFQTLKTDVILLRLFLGLRPLIRENVSSLWQPATVKKKNEKNYNPFYFLYGWLWVCVQASVRLCVTAVSCDVAMTTDYTQRERSRPKNQPSVTKSHGKSSGPRISVVWGKQDRKTEERWTFMLRKKKRGKTAADHWSKHSVISTTVPLIRRALPVTALRNTSA